MSDINQARRTRFQCIFDGTDITSDIAPYLLSVTYIDNDDSEGDDLQLQLQDRDKIWLNSWLPAAVETAAGNNLKIRGTIIAENWASDGKDQSLDCGEFELDSVNAKGPPNTVTIKATSLPYSSQIRQTKVSKAWEAYHLSGILSEIASKHKMSSMFDAENDPYYKRVEQTRTTDIKFLLKLCQDAGLNLKATDGTLVIYDQAAYEAKEPVIFINQKNILDWNLNTQQTDTEYQSCRVSYVMPDGTAIEGIAKVDDYDEKSTTNQQLEIYAQVADDGEAKTLAAKHLRLHNKFSRQVSFTVPGNPLYLAGEVMEVSGFGMFDGRYLCTQAKHAVGGSGYKTTLTGRRILEGY